MPNEKRLDPRVAIAEVQQLTGEIEERLSRIFILSDTIYTSVRHGHFRQERERIDNDLRLVQSRLDRATSRGEPHATLLQLQNTAYDLERQLEAHDAIVPIYMRWSNAWKRLAGSMHQGLRRTASMDRVVLQVQQRHGVTSAPTPQAPPPSPPPTQGGGVEELVELYGEETVNGDPHASER